LIGTLAGLFVGTALLHPRRPLSWRPARATFLAAIFLSAVTFWWII